MAAGNVLLVGAWLLGSRHTLVWLARCLTDPGSRTNAILLAIAALVLVVQARPDRRWRALPFATPRVRWLPVVLLVLCALAASLKARLWGSNLLASTTFVVGSHALLGLYLPPARWRRGWLAVLAVVALLPLGPHLDAFLGFPARIATAHLVRTVLGSFGVVVQSAEAIVILENGVASIDLPCSGVKGLWVGGVFFLALTWLEQRAVGWRWLGAGFAVLATLAAANFLRVLLIVSIGFAWQQPALADLAHLPLGVFGFVVACGLAVALIRQLPRLAKPQRSEPDRARSLGLAILPLAAALLLLAGTAARAGHRAHAVGTAALRWPQAWAMTALPLDDKEARLFQHHGARQAGKWRFQAGEASGTLLVVVADSFRAHHAPEVCLAGAGHRIDGVRREQLGPGRPLHIIDVDDGRASAATWFQSARSTTDSLMRRTLAEFLDGEQRWALVSVLFDGPIDLDAGTRRWLEALHQTVAAALASPAQKGS